jgi:hypothetical protein
MEVPSILEHMVPARFARISDAERTGRQRAVDCIVEQIVAASSNPAATANMAWFLLWHPWPGGEQRGA